METENSDPLALLDAATIENERLEEHMDAFTEASRMARAQISCKPAEAWPPIEVARLIKSSVDVLNLLDHCIEFTRSATSRQEKYSQLAGRAANMCKQLKIENNHLKSLLEEQNNG